MLDDTGKKSQLQPKSFCSAFREGETMNNSQLDIEKINVSAIVPTIDQDV